MFLSHHGTVHETPSRGASFICVAINRAGLNDHYKHVSHEILQFHFDRHSNNCSQLLNRYCLHQIIVPYSISSLAHVIAPGYTLGQKFHRKAGNALRECSIINSSLSPKARPFILDGEIE